VVSTASKCSTPARFAGRGRGGAAATFEMSDLLRVATRLNQVMPLAARGQIMGSATIPYATPSFFCKFVLDVVYWNIRRSPGLM
jgi:hypothetical protein